jgi:hypothetical protein
MKNARKLLEIFDMIFAKCGRCKKQIYFSNPEVEQNNAILEELETFADAINTIRPLL